jgi:hypothetical protein
VLHPLVVQADLISRFRYWDEGVHEGMFFKNEIYTYFQSFSASDRLRAYAIAYELIDQGNTVCISAAQTDYSIWLCLRSQPRSVPSLKQTIAPSQSSAAEGGNAA